MVTPVGPTPPPFSSTSDPVRGTALRRQLQIELNEIKIVLNQSPLKDETTELLRLWHKNFYDSLQLTTCNEQQIQTQYITLLQSLLKDPIFLEPLCERPLLGSDNKTYGYKSLSCYLSALPPEHWQRSPFSKQPENHFTVHTHPIAFHMIQWLKNKGGLLPSIAIENTFKALERDNLLPKLPLAENKRYFERMERKIKKEAQQRNLEEDLKHEADEHLDDLDDIIEEKFAEIFSQLEKDQQTDIEELKNLEEKLDPEFVKLKEAISELRKKCQKLEEDNEALKSKLKEANHRMDEAEQENIQLQISINETAKAIQERQADALNDFLTAVVVIGVCCFVTWASGGLSLPSSAKIIASPTAGGAACIFAFAI